MQGSTKPKPTRKRLRWLEWGLYVVAVGCVLLWALQRYAHRWSQRVREPTGEVLSDLEASDRIPLESGSCAAANVLIITLDTTRADHIGCYGNLGIRTPVIDGLARRGVLFANAFTPSPSTLPGHASILTGLYPHNHGARANGTFHLAEQNTTLAEILKANGYTTAAFIAAYVLDSRFGLDQGFDLYDDDLAKGVKYAQHMFRERPADFVVNAVLEWAETVADGRFFAWVHFFDPHAPYLPPEPYRRQYAHNLYDGEIAYADSQIGRLLEGLEQLGVLENTLTVVAADHGEGLGEHGELTHSLLIYDATLHTPLVFCPPSSQPLGLAVDRQVSNVDVVPTVLDLLGIKTETTFDGTSLLAGAQAHPESIYIETISTLVLHGWSPLFGVRQQDAKYIHAPTPELYDLQDDPKELVNLLTERPEQAAALSRELSGYIGADRFGTDALKQMVKMDPETRRQMEALGYAGTMSEASVDLEQAALFDPKEMVPHWERVQNAQNMMLVGKFREALAELETCLEAVPDDVWTMRLLTSAYLEQGEMDRAEAMALRVLEREQNEPAIYLQLGQVQISRGQPREAERWVRKALEIDPEFAPAFVAFGSIYARTGRLEEALEFYQKAIALDPGTTGPGAYNAMGNMHLSRMDFEAAREAFNASLELDRLNGGAHAGLASVLIEEDKLDEAEKELEIAVRFQPNDRQVLSTLAALHNKRGDYEQGLELAQRSLQINESQPSALNALGSARRNLGDLQGARETFEKVLEQHPDYVPCIVNLAQVYIAQRREEKAAEFFERALQVNPRQPVALFNLGTYAATHGRRDEALDYYRRAVAADPDYAMAHQHLGMLLYMQEKHAEALRHLERSLELDPQLPERERLMTVIEALRQRPGPASSPATAPAASKQP